MIRKNLPLCLTIISVLFITSCSSIRPTNYPSQQTKKAPTVVINDFKDETKKITLDKVIVKEEAPKKREDFFLELKNKDTTNKWIKYFSTNGKRGFEIFLKNGERYKPIISKIFKKHNLPQDLYYVGLIESGYKNHARSHAAAVGPWQFIKETARRYGLKVTRSIDERKNIYKSTQAAALYFQDLYNIFGSWELALSAYNAGEYGVIRRIRGANTRDYYELSKRKILPKETRNYVPKIIAAMHVDKQRAKYNVKVQPQGYNPFVTAKSYQVKGSMSLSKLANKLKVSKHDIKKLNHDIKGDYIPYLGRTGFEIYLPQNSKTNQTQLDTFLSKNTNSRVKEVKTYPKKVTRSRPQNISSQRVHKVRKNESLFSISKRYNVTLKTLRRLNGLKGSTIYVGQKINLPGKSLTQIKYSYTVKKGDHLSKIAKMFKTRIKNIKNLNKLRKSQIYVGQKLKVPAHQQKIHVVKKGDALIRIAQKYSTTVAQIRNLNSLRKGIIYPGQKIIVKMVKI